MKREVEKIIKNKQEQTRNQIELALLKYGNLFLLYVVFKQLKKDIFGVETSEDEFAYYKKNELPKQLNETIAMTENYLNNNGKSSRLWMLFNSPKKSNDIKSFILQKRRSL